MAVGAGVGVGGAVVAVGCSVALCCVGEAGAL